MKEDKKRMVAIEAQIKYILTIFGKGVQSCFNRKGNAVIALILALSTMTLWLSRDKIITSFISDSPLFPLYMLYEFTVVMIILATLLIILFVFGIPYQAAAVTKNLTRIGFTNSAGETPKIIGNEVVSKDKLMRNFEFINVGIPLSKWHDRVEELESALDCIIIDIKEGKSKKRIIVELISARNRLVDYIEWDDKFQSYKDFELVIGQGVTGLVYWNLDSIPHGLIGGSTGSGKTVLLKTLLLQCVMKNAIVHIADFKGGVDFGEYWRERGNIITEKKELLECLESITNVLEERKCLFRDSNCKNIQEYNNYIFNYQRRIVFACDEIAEILDKTGVSGEDKKIILEIENRLSTIARQGRAFGIHLILGTQRPDATILSGQIRNNIDFRICGRADDVLSKIILDNTSASDAIPKKAQGRFVTGDGQIIQSFYLEI